MSIPDKKSKTTRGQKPVEYFEEKDYTELNHGQTNIGCHQAGQTPSFKKEP
jgi:hypothetical protein